MTMAEAFNEWMRRATKNPEQFLNEFLTREQYNRERRARKKPTYGDDCARYLRQLMREPSPKPAKRTKKRAARRVR